MTRIRPLFFACLLLLAGAPGPVVGADNGSIASEAFLGGQEAWKGDLDGMIKRRFIRALVVESPMFYFIDAGRQRGVSYEALMLFEKFLNKKFGRSKQVEKIHVVFIPARRDQLFKALAAGEADLAVANITDTPERRKLVDFSAPFASGVKEIVLGAPGAPALSKLEDLAGREVYVRKSSSYYESLVALDARLRKQGLAGLKLVPADESLQDDDLVEMLNADLMSYIVMDDHKARFWAGVFPKVKVYADLSVRDGGTISWAMRKGSPKLKAAVDEFARMHPRGSLMSNMLLNRYLRDNKWLKNSLAGEERKKFKGMIGLFEKYSRQYGFDPLKIVAQGYQESGLDQTKRNPSGAIGVMQILPSTASDPNVDVPDVQKLENNIHAGVKYMRFLRDRYFNDPAIAEVDQVLFSFAAYNAGPARVAQLRKEAAKAGLDPDKWFENVEMIAARRIGRETVQYVANIYKYYLAYRLVAQRDAERDAARKKLQGTGR